MTEPHFRRRAATITAASLTATLFLAGCTSASTSDGASTHTTIAAPAPVGAETVFDQDLVHTIDVQIDRQDLTDMLNTYSGTGEKEWIRGTVAIDAEVFTDVGVKLKGNSSLMGVDADTDPVILPWRIRLDKYVDDQDLDGYTDFTVRSSDTETSLNEAVALDLLGEAGLATEQAAATRFSVNGSEAQLRLTVQNLKSTGIDRGWVGQNFPDAGADSVLYKAKAGGNWDYHGDEPDNYSTSFGIEAGDEDYGPLIDLLELLADGTDEEKADRLPELVDLEAFATYLSFEELIGNFDDIDGPGNNAYLFWDSDTERFTVVAWDHNMAFGVGPGMPGGDEGMELPAGSGPSDGFVMPDGSAPPAGEIAAPGAPGPRADQRRAGMPDRAQMRGSVAPPEGVELPDGVAGGRGAMPGTGTNPLVAAFDALDGASALREDAAARLRSTLVDSGVWDATIDRWQDLLIAHAGDLVTTETVIAEATTIRETVD